MHKQDYYILNKSLPLKTIILLHDIPFDHSKTDEMHKGRYISMLGIHRE